jgi:hypothetical protein
MTNYFRNISEDQEFSGLNLILGGYAIHLLECESHVMNKMLKSLNDFS